jgi:hypothetical protein
MAEKIKLEVEVDSSQGEKAMGDMDKATTNTKQGVGELSGGLNAMTGGAVAGFTAMKAGLITVVRSFTTLKGAIAATGIGALLIAFGALISFFNRTERGAQGLRVITAALGAAMDIVADQVTALGEVVFKVFGFIGKAISSISGSQDNFLNKLISAGEEAAALEERLNAVKVSEREINVERAEALKLIAQARLAAEDESKSAEERKNAIKEAADIEAEITKRELANEMERLKIMEAQAAMSESDEETLEAIAQQKQRVSQIELASFNLNRRLKLELNTLDKEIRAEEEAYIKAKAKREAARLAAEKEEAKIFLEETKALRQLQADEEISFITEQEERKLAVRTDFGEKYVLQEEKFMQKRAKMTSQDALNTVNAVSGMLSSLADLNAGAEAKTEAAKKKQFKRGQALAIAQALIDTFQSALGAFKATVGLGPAGPILAPIAAAGATAFGLARVASIKRQKYSGGGGGASSGGGPSLSIPRETIQTNAARGIDIDTDNVGADTGNITKTYVLSKDVSSKQELDAAIKRESVI